MRLLRRYRQDVERIAAEFRISQDIEYEILVKVSFRICVEFRANLMQNSTFFNEALFGMDVTTRLLFQNGHANFQSIHV